MIRFFKIITSNENKIILILQLTIIICFISCNAPRDNPLDPGNPLNDLGTIQGFVQTFSLPFTGISDATVYWANANNLVKSDANGKFILNNIPMKNGSLIIQKLGYKTDTVKVDWSGLKIINLQINLNSLPTLDSVLINTVVINQYNPDQTFQLNILAKISDRDNDLDSVKVVNDQLSLNKKLIYDISLGSFEISLSTNNMNISDLEEVIGLDFNIIVYDRFKNVYNIGSNKVTRVIKTPIVVQSPANSEVVNSNPILIWQRFRSGYPFTYTAEVYTNDFANSQLVVSQKNISSDSTSYFVKNTLQPGDYYWVLWVVDQFQNKARSKPATFTVN